MLSTKAQLLWLGKKRKKKEKKSFNRINEEEKRMKLYIKQNPNLLTKDYYNMK